MERTGRGLCLAISFPLPLPPVFSHPSFPPIPRPILSPPHFGSCSEFHRGAQGIAEKQAIYWTDIQKKRRQLLQRVVEFHLLTYWGMRSLADVSGNLFQSSSSVRSFVRASGELDKLEVFCLYPRYQMPLAHAP